MHHQWNLVPDTTPTTNILWVNQKAQDAAPRAADFLGTIASHIVVELDRVGYTVPTFIPEETLACWLNRLDLPQTKPQGDVATALFGDGSLAVPFELTSRENLIAFLLGYPVAPAISEQFGTRLLPTGALSNIEYWLRKDDLTEADHESLYADYTLVVSQIASDEARELAYSVAVEGAGILVA